MNKEQIDKWMGEWGVRIPTEGYKELIAMAEAPAAPAEREAGRQEGQDVDMSEYKRALHVAIQRADRAEAQLAAISSKEGETKQSFEIPEELEKAYATAMAEAFITGTGFLQIRHISREEFAADYGADTRGLPR